MGRSEEMGSAHHRRTTAFTAMTTAERVARFHQLYEQLDELTTADEMGTYPYLQHLGDLIEDLEQELED